MMLHFKELFARWDDYVNTPRKTRKDARRLHYDDTNRICFDIEVSSAEHNGTKIAWPYIIMVCINGNAFYSRRFEDARDLFDRLQTDRAVRVVYVHNLSYEFQFLRNILEFDDVFARTRRKPLLARYGNVEFRCSYFLSNMSLAQVGENYCTQHKAVGDLDYTKIRTPRTMLTGKELHYCAQDVLVLDEYIAHCLRDAGGKYKQIPYTSTGYVRQAYMDFLKNKNWYKSQKRTVKTLSPPLELHMILQRAYCGGITHANYMCTYRAKTFSGLDSCVRNVWSCDKASSYPWAIVSQKYPMTEFRQVKGNCRSMASKPGVAWVARVTLHNITTRSANCLLSRHKCFGLDRALDSNGRIYRARRLSLYCTDIDLANIFDMYVHLNDDGSRRDLTLDDVDIDSMWYSTYGYLTKSMVLFVLDLYRKKTTLKGVEGKETLYAKSKRLINSVYGMCVMDPYSDHVHYNCDRQAWDEDAPPVEQDLLDYYEKYKTVLCYQWGVWITAHARRSLVKCMRALGDDCLYVDTDSVKFPGDHSADIERINAEIHADNRAACKHFGLDWSLYAPKDKHGTPHEIGLFETEYRCQFFKTLGCKRYIVVPYDGDIHATVAGVPKIAIDTYLNSAEHLEEMIDRFCDHMQLSGAYRADGTNDSHKITMTYIDADAPVVYHVIDYLGDPDDVTVGHCIHASGADFSMTVAEDYMLAIKTIVSEKKRIIRRGVTI